MSSQIYKQGCKCYIERIPRIAFMWMRSCGTRGFMPNSVWCLVRAYCSNQTSTEISVQERRKTSLRPTFKKIKRQPFIKDLFLGKFDKDVLAFPEILETEHINSINNDAQIAREIVNRSISGEVYDTVSPVVLQRFKDLGYFGLEIPAEYDGAGLMTTETIRMAEAWGVDLSVGRILNTHHSVAVHAILKRGSDKQKKNYLPALARGEKIAAFCLTELSGGSDISMIESKLEEVENEEGKYLLNGTKTWVTNGGLADVFLVFAHIKLPMASGIMEPHLTAILIDREKHGVLTEPSSELAGVRGLNTSTVYFKNTPVSAEDIVGNIGDGLTIATDVMSNNRLAVGGNVVGVLKEMIDTVTEHCINRKAFDTQLFELELIQNKLSHMICTAYAIESMTYLTAGLVDSTEDPDLQLEMATVKVFSSEGLWQCCSEALKLLGADGYKHAMMEKWIRDARALPLIDGTNEVLKLYISLIGCNHAGQKVAEDIRKTRKPLFNPMFMLKTMLEGQQYVKDTFKLDLDLCGYVHLSLKEPTNLMEYCVKKFSFVISVVLGRHGADVTAAQVDLERLARIAMEIYCMAAVLSRCSRSYCIGLRNETHELIVATVICRECHKRVKGYFDDILMGPFENNNKNYKEMAKVTFRDRGYSLVPPITRNW